MVNLEEVTEIVEVSPNFYEERTTSKEVGNKVTTENLPSDAVSSENYFPFPESLSVVDEPSLWESLFESYLTDSKLLYRLEEVGEDFYAVINTFTFGELAIFILLFVFYLTYLIFKFWGVFR